MQNRSVWNWIIFGVLALAIMVGWQALILRIWGPPRQRKQPAASEFTWPLQDLSAAKQSEALGRLALATAPNGTGLANAYQAATGTAIMDWASGTTTAPPKVVKHTPPHAPKRLAAPRHDNIAMGGKDVPMEVRFTTHGAAIQELVLNRFKQATEMGLPADETFTLIPNDADHGSELFYSYPQVDSENPVATLGEAEWAVQSAAKGARNAGFVVTDKDGTQSVTFTTMIPDQPVRVTKTYSLRPGDYHLGLSLKFERTDGGTEPLKIRYQLAGAHGIPIEGVWYTSTFRNALIGSVKDKYVARNLQDSGSIAFKAGGEEIEAKEGTWVEYAAVANQYFASAIVVGDRQDKGVDRKSIVAWARPTVEPGATTPIDGKIYADKQFMDDITVRLVSQPVALRPGEPVVHRYVLYNGPVKVRQLYYLEPPVPDQTVNYYLNDLRLDTFTDVPSPATPRIFEYIGWSGLLVKTTNFMHWFLWWLHWALPNYGICIIIMTLMVRAVMYPLSRRQALASAKIQAKMQELQPEIKKLEEKHRGDSRALQQAKTELMLKRGVHPFAMMGSCWILFLQMPIFLGLYYALQESIHFRLARFLWMPNLAAPDMLLWWSTHIPYISRWSDLHSSMIYLGPYLNLLPVLAVIIMAIQQQLMAPPATDEQTATQQKMMKYMSIFIGFMFYKIASGLALYFIVSSLWGVLERKFLPKRNLAAATTAGAPPKKADSGGARKTRGPKGGRPDIGDGLFHKLGNLWQKVLKEAQKK